MSQSKFCNHLYPLNSLDAHHIGRPLEAKWDACCDDDEIVFFNDVVFFGKGLYRFERLLSACPLGGFCGDHSPAKGKLMIRLHVVGKDKKGHLWAKAWDESGGKSWTCKHKDGFGPNAIGCFHSSKSNRRGNIIVIDMILILRL